MAVIHGLTDAQVAALQRFIDQRVREIANQVPHGSAPPQILPDQIGRVSADVTAGTLDPALFSFQPKRGPADSSPDTDVGPPLPIHYAWVDIATTDWAGMYDWMGKRYVTLLKCSG